MDRFQMSPEMKWSNIEIDHVKPNSSFDTCKDEAMHVSSIG